MDAYSVGALRTGPVHMQVDVSTQACITRITVISDQQFARRVDFAKVTADLLYVCRTYSWNVFIIEQNSLRSCTNAIPR